MPLKATLKPKEVLKATKPKRKAPLARHAVPSKRRKSGSNQDKSHPVVDEVHVNDYVSDSAEVIEILGWRMIKRSRLKAVTLLHKRCGRS